jgi:hypothetical protein
MPLKLRQLVKGKKVYQMKALIERVEQTLVLTYRTKAKIVTLIMILLSFTYLPFLNWEDLSLKHNENPSLREAQSILQGRITLSERTHDTALSDGQPVNVFQPGQTLFFLIHLVTIGKGALEVFQAEMFFLFVVSAALFGLALFHLSGGKLIVSSTLAASALFGAPYIANLRLMMVGSMYRVNHGLSILFLIGLLILLTNDTVEKRMFVIGGCIAVSMLFRAQNVLLLTLPLSYLFQDSDKESWQITEAISNPASRKRLIEYTMKLMVFPLLAILIIIGFQTARFGDPFKSGYISIYEGRNDYLAQRADQHGLFSLRYLPENLFRTLCAIPKFNFQGMRLTEIIADPRGNSLLFTQPILLMGLFLWPGLKNAQAQAFLLTSLLLAIPVWLYHNPGFYAPGYMRLSLDYLFLWIATLAVMTRHSDRLTALRRGLFILAGFSVLYGRALLTTEVAVKTIPGFPQ